MVPTRQERGQNIARMRNQQILDAALEVFAEKGFASATTAEIAQAAGVAEGTIYNYFKSKRELFIAVIKNLIITIPMLELIEKLSGDNFEDVFRNILKNRLDLSESGLMPKIPSLMGEVQRDSELKDIWAEEFLNPFMSRLEGMYRAVAASGKFRPLEPVITVRVIGGLILGFLMLKVMEGRYSPLGDMPQEKIAEEMVEFVLHGLLRE
jgi:AcrR family transcriptional regulator